MNIDRRSFIQAVAVAGSASALMAFVPLSSMTDARSVQSGGPAEAADSDSVVFTIDGWEVEKHGLSQDEVRIRINQSWRSAWR